MKQLGLLYLLTLPAIGMAQQGVGASGGTVSNSTGSVSFTAGQPVNLSATSASGDLNEGMQQPYEFLVLSVAALKPGQLIDLYPNPTTDLIKLRLTGFNHEMHVFLYDQNGKQLQELAVTTDETELSLADYANGSYRLVLLQNQKQLKSYQIIKNQ